MSNPTLPPYDAPFLPVPQVTPFTYRDGVTMLKRLELLVKYINRELVPFVNENYSELAQAFQDQVNILIAQVNAVLEAQTEDVDQKIADLETFVNEQVQLIINDSIQVQDPVVAALVADTNSATSDALDLRYAAKSDVDALETLVTTGRLSEAELSASYASTAALAVVADLPPARNSKLSAIPALGVREALSGAGVKLAGVLAGSDTLRVLAVGDSTTAGNDADTSTDWPSRAWPAAAARTLTEDGIPAESGLGVAPSTATLTVDGRWTVGSGWSWLNSVDIGWGQGVCLRTSNAGTAAGTLQFAPGFVYEKIDVYFTRSTNSSFQAVLDVIVGGNTLGQVTNVGDGVGKLTFTPVSPTSAPVILDPVSGNAIYILGIEAYTETGTVRLANAGVAGSTTANWKNDNGGYAALDCIRAYAPDLTVIMLGINDSGWTPPRDVSGVVADLTTIGTAADASGDVLLMSFIPSSPDSDKDTDAQATYVPAIRDLAAAQGWGYVDITARFHDFALADSRGFMSDLVHGNEAGYRHLAYAVVDALESLA